MSTCRACREPIIFAVVSNRQRKPPSRMPLNPKPDPAGNVAVYRDAAYTLIGRVLGKGGTALGYEQVYMPHFATCKQRQAGAGKGQLPTSTPPGVTDLGQYRKRRRPKRRQAITRQESP